MAQFEIGDYTYENKSFNAIEQDRLVRRLGPIMPALSGWEDAQKAGLSSDKGKEFVANAVRAIDDLGDEKSLFIYAMCLGKCQRRRTGDGGQFVDVWNAGLGRPQHADINFGVMLRITSEVIKAELTSFF